MGFRVLVGDPISEGPRIGPDSASHGGRGVRGRDVESYIGRSRGTRRKCGAPSRELFAFGTVGRVDDLRRRGHGTLHDFNNRPRFPRRGFVQPHARDCDSGPLA